MAVDVEVMRSEEVPDGVAAIGVPVWAGPDGPALPSAVVGRLAGVDLPGQDELAWSKSQGFTGKAGKTCIVRRGPGAPAVILLGLGPSGDVSAERWRRAAAALVRQAGEHGTAAFLVLTGVDEEARGVPAQELGAAAAEGAVLAGYRFEEFRTTPRPGTVERVLVVPSGGDADQALAEGVRRGVLGADAVGFARDLVNTPPSDLPPRRLAERVLERLRDQPGVSAEVWDEDRIGAERLGGLLGVSRGSGEPPRLLRATYEPTDPLTAAEGTPHVVLVGKGITFDSGGLSLKTPEGMTTMKTDMTGAAVVLATLGACAALGVRVRVTAIAPITENMPGGRAVKPGDVLTVRNGSTIEVLNTDAEGRLVLADALTLATELEPSAIVDIATLTGAVVAALGGSIAGIFGNDDGLVDRLRRSGNRAGEALWPLPLPDEYADHIDSEIADMKNVGKPGQAGAIAAALLLARFVGDVPWAHLDIAGTGRSPEATGYLSKGGTAFGVRTLLDFLTGYGVG